MRRDMKDVIVNTTRFQDEASNKEIKENRRSLVKQLVKQTKIMTQEDREDFDYTKLNRRNPRRTKEFGDRIMPMRRWLRNQVGRPWDQVFSELCDNADERSIRGWHLKDHVIREVYTKGVVIKNNGELWESHGEYRITGLYVDSDGILQYIAPDPRHRRTPPRCPNHL